MEKLFRIFCLFAVVFSCAACEKSIQNPDPDEGGPDQLLRIFDLTVASEVKRNAFDPRAGYSTAGFVPLSYWVKEAGDAQWNAIPTVVFEGFDYEPGNEYKLQIRDFRGKYVVLNVLSATEKTSENIPDSKPHEIKNITVASKPYLTDDGQQLYGVRYGSQEPESRLNMPPLRYWGIFPGEIEGFDYEPGYEYVIDIRYDDLTNWRYDKRPLYYLVRERGKTPKTSEYMDW